MDIIIKKGPSEKTRKRNINRDTFGPLNVGEGGPINEWQHCGFVTNVYRKGHEGTFGEQNIFKNLAK